MVSSNQLRSVLLAGGVGGVGVALASGAPAVASNLATLCVLFCATAYATTIVSFLKDTHATE